ncbi:MAG: hypothetical protein ACRCST_00285, partial [Turicibacter sp.]
TFKILAQTLSSDHPENIMELCHIDQDRFYEIAEKTQTNHVEFYEHEVLHARLNLTMQRFNEVKNSLNLLAQSLDEDNPDGLLTNLYAARLAHEESGSVETERALRKAYILVQNAVITLDIRIDEAEAYEASAQDAWVEAGKNITEFSSECLDEISGNINDFKAYREKAHWEAHLKMAHAALTTPVNNDFLTDSGSDTDNTSTYSLVGQMDPDDEIYSQVDDIVPVNRPAARTSHTVTVQADIHADSGQYATISHHLPVLENEDENEYVENAPPLPPRRFSFTAQPLSRTVSLEQIQPGTPITGV